MKNENINEKIVMKVILKNEEEEEEEILMCNNINV